MKAPIPGPRAFLRASLSEEAVVRPTYTGSGEIFLEASLGGFHALEVQEKPWILERGAYWASEASVDLGVHRETVLNSFWTGEGFIDFQTKVSGHGKVVLNASGPVEEIDLGEEEIAVEGRLVIARSSRVKYFVRRPSRGRLSSWLSRERLLRVYRDPGASSCPRRHSGATCCSTRREKEHANPRGGLVRLEDGDCWVLRRVEVKATGAAHVGRHGRRHAAVWSRRQTCRTTIATHQGANDTYIREYPAVAGPPPRKPPRCRPGFLGYPLARTQSRAWTRTQIRWAEKGLRVRHAACSPETCRCKPANADRTDGHGSRWPRRLNQAGTFSSEGDRRVPGLQVSNFVQTVIAPPVHGFRRKPPVLSGSPETRRDG